MKCASGAVSRGGAAGVGGIAHRVGACGSRLGSATSGRAGLELRRDRAHGGLLAVSRGTVRARLLALLRAAPAQLEVHRVDGRRGVGQLVEAVLDHRLDERDVEGPRLWRAAGPAVRVVAEREEPEVGELSRRGIHHLGLPAPAFGVPVLSPSTQPASSRLLRTFSARSRHPTAPYPPRRVVAAAARPSIALILSGSVGGGALAAVTRPTSPVSFAMIASADFR